MKLKGLFKIFASVGLVTAGGLAIGLFVDMIPDNYANVRMFDKNTYNAWKQNEKLKINYANLPTSRYSFRDILDNPKSVNGGNFLFFFGSQAYKATNSMLWGFNSDFVNSQGEPPVYENAIMQKVYETFWGEDAAALGVDKIDPIFLNYVDIVEKQSLFDAWDLKKQRASSLGNFETQIFYPNKPNQTPSSTTPQTPPGVTDSDTSYRSPDGFLYKKSEKIKGCWYYIDTFKWAVGEGIDVQGVPVVKGASSGDPASFTSFDFTPNVDSFYEWRPNDQKDTEYEKVYYRNDDSVKNFLYNYNFIDTYVNNVYKTSGVNKEGMLLCVRNLNPKNYTTEFSNPFQVRIFSGINPDQQTVGNTIDEIIKFYNPDYSPDDNNENNSEGGDTPPPPPAPAPTLRTAPITQQEYHLNQLTDNLQEAHKNIALVNPKDEH